MPAEPRIATKAPARRRGVAALCAGIAGMGILYPTPYGVDNAEHGQWSSSAFGSRVANAQGAPSSSLQSLATGAMAAFKATVPPAPVEGIEIVDATGKPRPLSDWKGRVVLLNLWATWCAPCLKEMPALDKLKAETGSPAFDVIALNIDKTPEKPLKFVADNGIKALEFLRDPTAKAFAVVKSQGMPTTLLIDRQGREIGRLVGPAEWDSAEAKALVKAAIAAK
jgi:thiol-disulfide isomerase/thioredoxin